MKFIQISLHSLKKTALYRRYCCPYNHVSSSSSSIDVSQKAVKFLIHEITRGSVWASLPMVSLAEASAFSCKEHY